MHKPTHSILFVCHGNICRSTMAEFVMQDLVRRAGLAQDFRIDSAATSREELGNDVHPGTRAKLAAEGVPCGHHRARQMGPADYAAFGEKGCGFSWRPTSARERAAADPDHKVSRLLDWAEVDRDVADPWYTGNFDATYDDVLLGCTAMLEALTR